LGGSSGDIRPPFWRELFSPRPATLESSQATEFNRRRIFLRFSLPVIVVFFARREIDHQLSKLVGVSRSLT